MGSRGIKRGRYRDELTHTARHKVQGLRRDGDLRLHKREQVGRVLSVLDLEDAFDVIATMGDAKYGKPDPEMDLLVAEKPDVPPAEVPVI